MPRHIVITKGTELHRFPLDALICVSADGNYSEVMTVDGRKTLICLQLGQIEALMVEQLGTGITNTVGVADNSPLFEQATGTDGYFFRQYPLVDNGKLVDNEPKNKAIRKALCERAGEIFVIKSETAESFHDFAQALVDLGVNNAIYLVGSTPYGFWYDKEGNVEEFSDLRVSKYKYESYILWRVSKQ